MPVRSAPFYWVECDTPGCQSRCPEYDDENVAWSDREQAHIVAQDSEWQYAGQGVWRCPACAPLDAEDGDYA